MAFGSMVKTAEQVWENLKQRGYACSLINARFAKPYDAEMLSELPKKHTLVVTMEENVASGGFGEHVAAFYQEQKTETSLLSIAIPDEYVEHGNADVLRHEVGIDAESVIGRIMEQLRK